MSTIIPSELKYTKEHEWVKYENDVDVATIGVTDFAQSSLGDIVYIELPEIGTTLDAMSSFGVIESIKSVSDLYAPLSGEIVEINNKLIDAPEIVNSEPYENWIIKLKINNKNELNNLLSAKEYETLCSECI